MYASDNGSHVEDTSPFMAPKNTTRCLASCRWQTSHNNVFDENTYLNSTKSKCGTRVLKNDNTIKGKLTNETSGPWPLWDHMHSCNLYHHYTVLDWCDRTNQHLSHYPLSLIETLCYNWRISYSGEENSAHRKNHISFQNFVPGNTKILYAPKQLLFIIHLLVVRQTIDRQYYGVMLKDVLILGVLFAFRCVNIIIFIFDSPELLSPLIWVHWYQHKFCQ